MSDWTFFSNHGHVLSCLVQDGDARLRDVAARVGITERAVQKIIRDMQDAGVLTVHKQGRRNRYRINGRKALRHELESHRRVSDLAALARIDAPARSKPQPAAEAGSQPLKKTAVKKPSSPRDESRSADAPEGDGDQGSLF